MLVVISDLHFQDFHNDVIINSKGDPVGSDKNVPLKAFTMFFNEIRLLAIENNATELIIVFAGDIFDIHRSQLWFRDPQIRPYDLPPPHSKSRAIKEKELEDRANEIVDAIIKSNSDAFELIRHFVEKLTSPDDYKPDSIKASNPEALKTIRDFVEQLSLPKGIKVEVQYIPGNHDRLVNLFPSLREKVKKILKCETNKTGSFEHCYPNASFQNNNYGVLIVHGHEFDSANFNGRIPAQGIEGIAADDYARPTLGDYATIDIAVGLAYEFRNMPGNQKNIEAQNDYQDVYGKLLEFDDLRPQKDLICFLESELQTGFWALLSPVLSIIVTRALGSEFVRQQLGRWKFILASILGSIPLGIQLKKRLIRFITGISGSGLSPREYAMSDPFLTTDRGRYIVAGHTHDPSVEFLRCTHNQREQFFFDTGTWRLQIRKCVDQKTFARAKALTYVVFYSHNEDATGTPAGKRKRYSFDYWSGFTKKEFSPA